jgi:hypothetical protein
VFFASCGGGGDDRSRNVETIAGTACAKKGATKTVSKLNYVCGVAPAGNVWFTVVGKLTTKGGKSCKPLGQLEAAKTRVCGTVKKTNIWVKVAPLPVAVSGIGETTVPATESTVVGPDAATTLPAGDTQTTTPTAPTTTAPSTATQEAVGELNEVARALAPPPEPKTVEELVELLVPRPVEAQAVPVVPTSIAVKGGAPKITNGSTFPVPLSATVLDQDNAPVAVEGNTIVATISRPDASLTNAVAVTDARGTATFPDLRVDGLAGPAIITVTADFGASVDIPVEVTAGPAVRLNVLNHPTQIIVSESLPTDPITILLDKDGNEVAEAGVEISAVLEGSARDRQDRATPLATVKTDATGTARFAGLKINVQLNSPDGVDAKILYSVPSDPSVAAGAVDVRLGPGSPNDLAIVTPPSSSARAGIPLETQPVVRIVDANGNPVAKKGISVAAEFVCGLSCPGDRQILSSQTVVTDGNGVARFTELTMRGLAGDFLVRYSASDYESGFSARNLYTYVNVTPGMAASIAVERTTAVFSYGATVESAFDLVAVDAWGNTADDFNEVLEVATSKSIDFSFPIPSRFRDGQLTLRNVTLKGQAGTISYAFGAGRISSAQQTLSLIAGAPDRMEILTRPGTISADATLTNPLAVQLVDAGGNNVNVPNLIVRISTSSPNPSVENVSTTDRGIAAASIRKFPNAGVTTVRYDGSLRLSGIPGVSDTITVVAGAAKSVRLLTSSSVEARSGIPLTSQPVLQLVDASGNDAAQASVAVTAKGMFGCPGDNPEIRNSTARSDSTGRIVYSGFTITATACGYTVVFCPSGGTCGGSLSVTLSAGDPAALDIVTQPSGAVNRKLLTTQPSVRVLDSKGNPLAKSDLSISATLDGRTTVAKTAADGVARFSGVTATGAVGSRTVRFTLENAVQLENSVQLVSATSASFSLIAGDATSIVPSRSTIAVDQGGLIPNIVVKDADGNTTTLDRQIIVRLSSTSGLSWLLGSTVRSVQSNGVADFGGVTVSSTSTRATLTYTVSGRNISAAVTVDFLRPLLVGTDLGPAGGVIIADINDGGYARKSAPAVSGLTSGGRYVEAAPAGWSGESTDPTMSWGSRRVTKWEVLQGVGYAADALKTYLGLFNLSTPGTTGNVNWMTMSAMEKVSIVLAADKNDWLLPTYSELLLMMNLAVQDNSKLRLSTSSTGVRYWSSNAIDYPFDAIAVFANLNAARAETVWTNQSLSFSVRPIRYFG